MINVQNEFQKNIEDNLKKIRSLREDLNVSGGLEEEEVRKIKVKLYNLKNEIVKQQDLAREVL